MIKNGISYDQILMMSVIFDRSLARKEIVTDFKFAVSQICQLYHTGCLAEGHTEAAYVCEDVVVKIQYHNLVILQFKYLPHTVNPKRIELGS